MALVCRDCGSHKVESEAKQRLVVKITYADGLEVTYPITPKIQIDFEKFYHKSVLVIDEAGITGTYELAFETQKVHREDLPGGVMPTFDNWAASLDLVSTEAEEIVPFGQTASNPSSSISVLPAESHTAAS